jgi:hypothetical protein
VPEFKADGGFEPETYMEYFEDSDPPANTEIGCKMPFLDGHGLHIDPCPTLQLQHLTRFIGGVGFVTQFAGDAHHFLH